MGVMNKRLSRTLLSIAICICILFAGLSVFSINSTSKALRAEITGKCANETVKVANEMSTLLEKAEGTVNMLAASAYSTFDMEEYKSNPEYMDEYIQSFDTAIKTALGDIDNAVGLFFTLNVDIVGQKEGYEIWYVYDDKGNIRFLDAAENGVYLEAFSEKDAGYMQYYFGAISKKGTEGVWVGPTYDPDIDKDILSYARAVYADDVLIGVVGIDLSTKNTTDMIMSVELESQGDIALFNQQGKAIVDTFDRNDVLLKDNLYGLFQNKDSALINNSHGTIEQHIGNDVVLITYAHLSNDWILVVTHDTDTIFATVTFTSVLIAVLAVFVAMLLIAALYFILKRYNTPYEEAAHLLKLMDLGSVLPEEEEEDIRNEEDIKELVNRHMAIQRDKDIMIAHQSRLAQAGEIMTGIAHQWKQPLNNINIIQGNLIDEYELGELTGDSLKEAVIKTQQQTCFMSETIDNFNRYLSPEDSACSFGVETVIREASALLTDAFKKNRIELEFSGGTDIEITGYPNALYQAVLNLLSNAVDALKTLNIGNRRITISIEESAEDVKIRIMNNGNPIPKEIMKNIFKPYFTTKGKAGTGLGLSISRAILEKTMNGKLTVENVENGVRSTITLPKGEHNG